MSAITPFLERQDDPGYTPAERRNFERAPGNPHPAPGGCAAPFDTSVLKQQVLNTSHAKLVRMAWVRRAIELELLGRRYRVQNGDSNGTRKCDLFIVFDEPVGRVPVFNPPAEPKSRNVSVLSWTSKMGCPSFSLPAGPLESGGSCPGARGGQSIIPLESLCKSAPRIAEIQRKPVELDKAVCQYCYAEGGQYGTGGVQFAQVARYVWAKQALRDGTFVPAMVFAIDNANYRLEGGKVDKVTYLPERHEGRFFRIHDSGDFFSVEYLHAWFDICAQLPGITFWAPARFWASNLGAAMALRAPPPNLIIRPSAYEVNEPAPNLAGWAAGSTVFQKDVKPRGKRLRVAGRPYDWDCQAYSRKDESATCRNAEAPDGQRGCRACWKYAKGPNALSVNYTLH